LGTVRIGEDLLEDCVEDWSNKAPLPALLPDWDGWDPESSVGDDFSPLPDWDG